MRANPVLLYTCSTTKRPSEGILFACNMFAIQSFIDRLCWCWCHALPVLSQPCEWPPPDRIRDFHLSSCRQLQHQTRNCMLRFCVLGNVGPIQAIKTDGFNFKSMCFWGSIYTHANALIVILSSSRAYGNALIFCLGRTLQTLCTYTSWSYLLLLWYWLGVCCSMWFSGVHFQR